MATNPFNADLDTPQILNKVYNPTDDTLRVDATVTAVIGDVVIDASTSSIAIEGRVSGNLAEVTPAGALKVDLEQVGGAAITLGQKTNAASIPVVISSNQTPIPVSATFSGAVDQGNPNTLANAWPVKPTDGTNSQSFTALGEAKVSITEALPSGSNTIGSINNISGTISLPIGASTSALQTAGNSSLSSIDSKIPSGLTVTSSRLLVDGSGVTQPVSGTVTANQGTSPWIISGTVTTSPNVNVHDGTGVSISSTGNSLNVDVTNTVPVSQSGTWNINNISGTISLPTGAATSANQSTEIASLSSIDGKLNSLGQKTMAGSVPVVIASDQSPITVTGTITTSPNVNVHDGSGVSISSTGSSLNVDVTNIVPVSQSGIWSTGRTWNLSSGSDSVSAVQSGTWNINNISGVISLPTGAATEATLAKLTLSQGSSTSGEFGPLVQGAVTTAAPTYVNGQTDPLSLDTSGLLRVSLKDTPSNTNKLFVTADPITFASPQHVILDSGTVTTITNPVTVTNAGTFAVQAAQSGTWNITNITGTISLPTGASTSSNQTTANTSLASIDSKTPALGQALAASSVPVVTQQNATPATQNITVQDTGSTTTAMANGQNYITGTPTAGSVASFSFSSFESVEVQVTGTWTGTLSSEISLDGGTTWFTRGVKQAGVSYIASTFTNNFAGGLNVTGMSNYRVRATAPWTGTAIVKIIESIEASSVIVSNPGLLRDTTIQSITNTIKAANTPATAADTALVVAFSPNSNLVEVDATVMSGYLPQESSYNTEVQQELQVDPSGSLQIRGDVLTDEGSFRDDFDGSSLTTTLTGTVTMTNGSTLVTGSGTAFTTQLQMGQYIKLSAASETSFVSVSSVQSDTALTLSAVYTGTTGSTSAVISNYITSTGSGATTTVATSEVTIAQPTTTGVFTSLGRFVDFGPMRFSSMLSISARVTNQTIIVGLVDNIASPISQATFQFSGTTNTSVTCVSQAGAQSQQTTTVTIPNGGNTSTQHRYDISVSDLNVSFTIDGILVAIQNLHIPSTYQNLYAAYTINNTGTASGTVNLIVDFLHIKNFDQIEVTTALQDQPLKVGGVYPGTVGATLTAGQYSDINLDQFSNVRMTNGGQYININNAATTTIKTGAGRLVRVSQNLVNANGDKMVIYDNTAGSGTTIATISKTGSGTTFEYELYFTTGLTVVTTGTSDWTVVYQ